MRTKTLTSIALTILILLSALCLVRPEGKNHDKGILAAELTLETTQDGNQERQTYVNSDGEPVIPLDRDYATLLRTKDDDGNVVLEQYLDVRGEPALRSGNYAAVSYRREAGEIQIVYLDAQLNPITITSSYNIPSTGLRFFTVYGPAGRPDMAYFGFTNKLRKGETIRFFNFGNCQRDFTYIDDIVEGVIRVMQGAPEKKNGEDGLPIPPYAVYNIGNQNPENLLDFVDILQQELIAAGVLPADYDFEAHKELVPMQPGDVPVTYADTSALERDSGFKPATPLRTGLQNFARWYKEFYRV